MTAIMNGTYSSCGWTDDFVDPGDVELPLRLVEQRRENLCFADLRPVIARSIGARLGREADDIFHASLARVTSYSLAAFGRGELAQMLDTRPSNVTRGLRQLKDADIITEASDTQHIYFAIPDYADGTD